MIEPIDLYWLNRRLDIAIEEVRRLTPDMAIWELRKAFPGLQTVSPAPNGNQIFNFEDKSIEVGPMASNDEIAVALENPFIRTENTKMTVNPIDRLKEKLAKAAGVGGRVAAKIEAKADALIEREGMLEAKTDQAFAPHEAIADQAATQLDEIEAAVNILSNGGPALDDPK